MTKNARIMEFTEQTLRSRLLSLGVHLELWGKDEAKSVEHLVEELNAGECVLDGKVRTIRPVVLDVWYLRMQLRETFQIFSDLRVRVRELKFGSVGEKLRIGEGAKAGAWRALREELGVKNRHDTYIDPLPGDEWEELSSSYPGPVEATSPRVAEEPRTDAGSAWRVGWRQAGPHRRDRGEPGACQSRPAHQGAGGAGRHLASAQRRRRRYRQPDRAR